MIIYIKVGKDISHRFDTNDIMTLDRDGYGGTKKKHTLDIYLSTSDNGIHISTYDEKKRDDIYNFIDQQMCKCDSDRNILHKINIDGI